MKRMTVGALALFVSMAFSTACSSNTTASTSILPEAQEAQEVTPESTTAHGMYVDAASADASTEAFAYDQELVPPAASSKLTLTTRDGTTTVSLAMSNFLPNRTYGAHLHVKPCAPEPKAAGPHFQHRADPAAVESPSVDPAYANPRNEVWLDFTTDASGNANVTTEVPWALTADRQPRSLVVHAEKTQTEPGKAGVAGARVGCLTLAA